MLGNALSLPHLFVIAVVLMVLFGRGKISSVMGEVGKGITAFKKGMDDGRKEIEDAVAQDVTPPAGAHTTSTTTATPSGTVTTISGIHLKLPMYDRSRVDGCWLNARDVRSVSNDLIAMTYAERVAQPCIGQERADLVLAGCAILEALLRIWPCQRLRVADRGLREGILATLMAEDGHGFSPRNRHGPWKQGTPAPR